MSSIAYNLHITESIKSDLFAMIYKLDCATENGFLKLYSKNVQGRVPIRENMANK